ncbi:MAG TPA: hypothetical protein VGM84_08810 [Steroidobacteraceae bacterium]|jgi:hypothetical protein
MVPVERENAYDLREHLARRAVEAAGHDLLKRGWLKVLGLINSKPDGSGTGLALYQRCALDGLGLLESPVSSQDLQRLLGQSATIDITPRPWATDVFGVLAVKWRVAKDADQRAAGKFKEWCAGFLPQQISGKHFNAFEHDVATFIEGASDPHYSTASIPLFLHYRGVSRVDDQKVRSALTSKFMQEFRGLAREDVSPVLAGAMVYVFDQVNQEIDLVPPNGWSLTDLLRFLEHLPMGLKNWTWEDKSRTRNGNAVKWQVENEYHVQNLLYLLLGPIFNDIRDEKYTDPVGHKTPRLDLYLPSLHTIIEVKYRKDAKKSFAALIGEVAEDASLYRADDRYRDARLVVFLWDQTRATQDHPKFREGVMQIPGIDGCVVVSAPSMIEVKQDQPQ